jgi:type IV secretory pathway ATPase VirB11/archaellum biosynthesis ATPase
VFMVGQESSVRHVASDSLEAHSAVMCAGSTSAPMRVAALLSLCAYIQRRLPGLPAATVHDAAQAILRLAASRATILFPQDARAIHIPAWVCQSLVELSRLDETLQARDNILISGGTGKTTLLSALIAFLPAQHRVGLIEDTAELQLHVDNLFRFEARREQAGLSAITIRDLLRASLRHRPDRILVGEVRGAEAFDLLQALNTGHAGTLSTIHANGAEPALRRFAWCVLLSGVEVPYPAIRYGLAECLKLLVHLERRGDHRLVTELVRVRRYNPGTDTYDLESL